MGKGFEKKQSNQKNKGQDVGQLKDLGSLIYHYQEAYSQCPYTPVWGLSAYQPGSLSSVSVQ